MNWSEYNYVISTYVCFNYLCIYLYLSTFTYVPYALLQNTWHYSDTSASLCRNIFQEFACSEQFFGRRQHWVCWALQDWQFIAGTDMKTNPGQPSFHYRRSARDVVSCRAAIHVHNGRDALDVAEKTWHARSGRLEAAE